MKNILQLFKKMQPKSYYGEGVEVKTCKDKKWQEEDRAYTSNTGFLSAGCTELLRRGVMGTVEETTDCRNIYSTSKSDMPVQGIGLTRIEK